MLLLVSTQLTQSCIKLLFCLQTVQGTPVAEGLPAPSTSQQVQFSTSNGSMFELQALLYRLIKKGQCTSVCTSFHQLCITHGQLHGPSPAIYVKTPNHA